MRKITVFILAVAAGTMFLLPPNADAHWGDGTRHWHWNRQASWYGPGFYGNRTACGETLTTSSWWVSAFKTENMRCDMKVRICKRGTRRCVHVMVQDSGAVHDGRRDWDMTIRVRRALRCPSTCDVNWKRGWQ